MSILILKIIIREIVIGVAAILVAYFIISGGNGLGQSVSNFFDKASGALKTTLQSLENNEFNKCKESVNKELSDIKDEYRYDRRIQIDTTILDSGKFKMSEEAKNFIRGVDNYYNSIDKIDSIQIENSTYHSFVFIARIKVSGQEQFFGEKIELEFTDTNAYVCDGNGNLIK